MSDIADKRITVFTGHYGSGKTEISINYAMQLKKYVDDLTVVDLDFVNPYFRSREARGLLNEAGIDVIASAEECFDTDLPAFSPRIFGALQNRATRVVIDLGGDETGARAIGRFRHQIANDDYEMLFVTNPFRPFTSTTAEVNKIISQIEVSGRLKVSSLISNPNLHRETTAGDVVSGHRRVQEMADAIGLPVKFLAVEQSLVENPEIKGLGLKILRIARLMLAPWEQA